MPRNTCSSFLLLGDGISVRALTFLGSCQTPSLETISWKNWINVHLKWHLSLFSFKLTSWHHFSTPYTALLWSLPSLSYPVTRMSSAILKTFGMSLNISSILHWNMLPTGTALNGKHLYLYLPNWHGNVVRYDDFLSGLRLWYLELASIIDMCLTPVSFGSISFSVGPLCIGLIGTWLSLAGSKHNHTLPFALGTTTKLLHHSDISSMPRVLWCPTVVVVPAPLVVVSVAHMPHTLVVLGMACCLA